MAPHHNTAQAQPTDGGRSALLVGTGILLSRLAGLVRDRVFAHYFGNSDAADAFRAAFRIPNFLQNLFGEGVLSASFIPVYAGLLARKDRDAHAVAAAIAAILAVTVSFFVLAGVWAAPYLITVIAPGFGGAKRELCVRLVRIFFPGAALLVLSAWCLGVLNSHRRFLLSYAAPVVWNAAIIAALLVFGAQQDQFRLAVLAAWGSVLGSLVQFGVQVPVVLRLIGSVRLSLRARRAEVQAVLRNFVPVFISRGVVQISAYIDALIASLLPTGAVAALSYAQTLYTLPVSLFGMAVSAAELPAMSGVLGNEAEVASTLRGRLDAGLRRIAFFIIPSAVAFIALGDVVVGIVYESGRFAHSDTLYVWGILAGSAVGLLASTMGRLYTSTFYAVRDTRTPLRFAILRVVVTTGLGLFAALSLPRMLGVDSRWGVVGLTASAGLAGWLEFLLLRQRLNARIGPTGLVASVSVRLWTSALLAAAVGWMAKLSIGDWYPLWSGIMILIPYGATYLFIAHLLGLHEARDVLAMIQRRR